MTAKSIALFALLYKLGCVLTVKMISILSSVELTYYSRLFPTALLYKLGCVLTVKMISILSSVELTYYSRLFPTVRVPTITNGV